MARKSKRQQKQAEAQQPDSTAGESTPSAASDSLSVETAEPVAPSSDTFEAVTPDKPNEGQLPLHEAILRYVDDARYRAGWDVAIQRHAKSLGHSGDCTAEEWLQIFRSFGLKVRE